ncbi:hypothetical protein QBC37DRAFT_173793 [Rhypophila decipiens]|uniref:Chromo domain-containing protein n=1 Tax=Rhypophila decipiens TaxID=261697 RepID=A0AAN6Y8L8_9PEZI|nr:hypothetical protein QBC37DRAFT_173793 [Rhypophila decipiens]
MINASTSSRSRRRRNDPGRRPRRQAASNRGQEERLYEIRDIKAEKWQGNTLLYLIDWADDRVTGEAYENTWEPAQNVTRAAIEDWEREKQRRQAIERRSQRSSVESSSESDSQPVRPLNWRKRRHQSIVSGSDRASLYKRARTSRHHDSASFAGAFAEEDWQAASPPRDRRGEIVLELRVDPGFDPREYIAISISQSSQGSQSNRSSGSSAPRTAASETEPRAKSKISQTTIPDSQEISDSIPSLPSQFTAEPLLAEASQVVETDVIAGLKPQAGDEADGDNSDNNNNNNHNSSVLQADPAPSEGSGLNIPSRQPDNLVSGNKLSQQTIGTFQGQDETSLLVGPQNPPLQSSFQPRTSSGFLTQPEFNLPAFSRADSVPEACGVDPASTPNTPSSHSPKTDDVPSHSQAAQVVAPLSSYPKQIRTQTQDIIESTESDVVPETVLKSAPRVSVAQGASRDFQEHDNTGHITDGPFPLPQRSPSAMSFPDDDESLSFAERLKRMRDSILSEPFSSSRHASLAPAPAPAAAPPQPQEQSVISPSSVLPAIDNDSGAQQGHGVSQGPVNTSNAWNDPSTGISLRSIDMAFSSNPDQTASIDAASLKVAQDLMGFPVDNPGHSAELPPSHFSTAHEQQSAFEQIPATIAPSELTKATAGLLPDLHALDSSGFPADSLLPYPVPESDQYHQDIDLEHHNEERAQGEYTVTLPMAANTRSEYLKRLSGENEETMRSFGQVFAQSLTSVPSDALLAKVDHIFQQLLDLCDLPAYVHDVSELNSDAMWKHATGTNSKFSFVFEFLTAIRDCHMQVLIICRPGYTFQYLEALLSAPGFNYKMLGQEYTRDKSGGLGIILASADQDLTVVGQVDIIISFDHVSRAVDLSQLVSRTTWPPLVLFLVVTHSIEHIDLQLGRELEGIERKNAIHLAIGAARELLKSPERNFAPHEVAEIFAGFVQNPEDGLIWEPSVVPEHVLDVWLSSQANTQDAHLAEHEDAINSRKRRLDEDEVGTPKRARILEPPPGGTPAQISDLLKSTLSRFSAPAGSPTQMVELPVSQLESMAAKIAELESNMAAQTAFEVKQRNLIKSLEAQVRSWEKSVNKIQPKYIEAVRDRGIFETENKAVKKQLEERDSQIAKLREQNEVLQAKLNTPELARSAAAEKEVTEAQAKIQSLEKRLAGAERDMDYLRGQYQTATSEAGKFANEKRELLTTIAELEKRASDNFLKAHLKNAEINAEEQLRLLREKSEMILNLERDLDRAREELRVLKSGRRETRQASVPRSPMPGAGGVHMSPRPHRNANASVGGQQRGSGSRGTSPAPAAGHFSSIGEAATGVLSAAGGSSGAGIASSGAFFTQPTGNARRFDHLRE